MTKFGSEARTISYYFVGITVSNKKISAFALDE